jgi:hypothetical protein
MGRIKTSRRDFDLLLLFFLGDLHANFLEEVCSLLQAFVPWLYPSRGYSLPSGESDSVRLLLLLSGTEESIGTLESLE